MTSSPYLMVPIPIVDQASSFPPGKSPQWPKLVNGIDCGRRMAFVATIMRKDKEQLEIGVARAAATNPRGIGISAKIRRLVYADKQRPRTPAGYEIVSCAVTVCGAVAN